jgi:predicted HD phosphohydrolase
VAAPEIRDLDDLVAALRAAAGLHDEGPGLPSILDHGLQCAALLACTHPDDLELQVAGLVHDVGWLARAGDRWRVDTSAAHDRAGAAAVEPLLGKRIARLVGGHVAAKRYLVAVERGYAGGLSETSTFTLAHQGGPMPEPEAAEFARSPDAADLVALRRADDAAKVLDAQVPGLERWLPALQALAR